jgi:hypothetical protein
MRLTSWWINEGMMEEQQEGSWFLVLLVLDKIL